MEHPELRCARVDLDATCPIDHIQPLVDELLADDAEDELALRGPRRLTARITRVHPPRVTTPFRAREDGTYLVTGGLGGLGLQVAAWLVERGAARLMLIGRRGAATEAQRAAVAALTTRGVDVRVIAADVSRRDELARALATLDPRAPLRGVVHAAGVADPSMLVDLTPARLREVMAAKARGALHLDALTRDFTLDFFVLYASMSGLLGLAGTGNYAAANALLDALAHHRRAQGRAALSVDWGVFAGVGLAAARDDRERARYSAGMRGMSRREGLDALERALASGEAQLAVAPFDAAQWVESYPAAAGSRRVAPLLLRARADDRLTTVTTARARLLGASAGERAPT
ncbi:MAG: SDR family NAD(P)-dependent oxidoreductase [Myxococcales bacterium]|nr:SDR family NAD(P)-dependent oxidoreductase [Myxococcales bacterium]